jgi:deoxyribonuclease V
VLTFPELEIIETEIHSDPIDFPYIPGLLGFREVPIFLQTFRLLHNRPDMFFFDGHGYAHPRRFGLACHAGVLVDMPAIGCAKSKLTGTYDEPEIEAGSMSPLFSGREIIGDVVRTKSKTKPIFVSPGHKVSFKTATNLTLQCVRGYRIPEPTRLAHNLVSGRPKS